MQSRRVMFALLAVALVAGFAAADTKLVQQHHTDAFTMMKQQQPAKDEQSTVWIGDGRLRSDQGKSSFIVRTDLKKMFMVNHEAKEYYAIDLPVDMKKLLPPGMADQMMQMMKMDAKVTPSEETKKIGEWTARRYDVAINSQMMQMKMQVWATKDLKLDYASFNTLFENIQLLSPGMDAMVQEMRKIDGYQVASETTMTMMGNNVKSTETTLSVEDGTAPAGTYEPPSGYAEKPFDLMKMQQTKK
jgi:hypothetical protein